MITYFKIIDAIKAFVKLESLGFLFKKVGPSLLWLMDLQRQTNKSSFEKQITNPRAYLVAVLRKCFENL